MAFESNQGKQRPGAGALDAFSSHDVKQIVALAHAGRAQAAINKVAFQ